MVFKWVLGRNYGKDQNQQHYNANIISQFVASLLDLNVSKPWIVDLYRVIFHLSYLDGLDEIVQVVVPSVGISSTMDLHRHVDNAKVVPWMPLLIFGPWILSATTSNPDL